MFTATCRLSLYHFEPLTILIGSDLTVSRLNSFVVYWLLFWAQLNNFTSVAIYNLNVRTFFFKWCSFNIKMYNQSFDLFGFLCRQPKIARWTKVCYIGAINKQLYVAAEFDHQESAEKRFRRIYMYKCECLG